MDQVEQRLIVLGLFGLGAILGSFISLLIYRLYHDEKGIINGRSECKHCHRVLHWYELIPLFSWIIQGGKCRKCGKKISPIYPLIELSFALFLASSLELLASNQINVLQCILIGLVLILFWYDTWFMTVDRRISFPAIGLAVLWIILEHPDQMGFYFAGGAVGGLFYYVQFFYSKGRWVGFGDVELGILMGLILGIKWIPLALFVAYLIGTLFILLLAIHHSLFTKTSLNFKNMKVPMGSFLMPSLILFMLYGDKIWDWYWGLVLI